MHTRLEKRAKFLAAGACQPIAPSIIHVHVQSRRRVRGEEENPGPQRRRITDPSPQTRETPAASTVLAQPPMLGSVRLHESHALHHRKGVIICMRCGAYAVLRANKLAKQCSVRLKSGKENLDRWSRGIHPQPIKQWPSSYGDLAEGLIWKRQL